jgi:hypothetical protein
MEWLDIPLHCVVITKIMLINTFITAHTYIYMCDDSEDT